jgi:[acyl-carrier-protein] S-malonyltransferase
MKRRAKRALLLPVGGAFHSNDGTSKRRVRRAIEATTSLSLVAPYQNVTAGFLHQKRLRKPDYTLTAPVKWTQSVQQMIADGATLFTEVDLKSISWVDCMKLIEK